jgi:type I restriction enzyme S subunit
MNSKSKTTATTGEATPALVPNLRFPEFRKAEGWHPKPLGNVATFFKGKGLPKSALSADGKNPCIHYGELFTEYQEVIRSVRSRTNLAENVFLSVANDVLMPTSDVTPSGLAKASCLNFANVILGGDILVIRTKRESVNGEFLARYIRHLESKVLQLVSGSTVFHLYANSMEKLVLSFPKQPAEQQKIAECLSSLDELIAAQARKLDALKTHKKGLMQQLFPREGETQPRLRFPEFQNAGEWEMKPLGKVAENLDNKRRPITSSDREAGDVPYYGASGIVDYVEGFIFNEDLLCVSEDGANLVARTYPIAFPISGKTWVNNHAHVLRFANQCTQKFVEVYLNSIKLDDFITGMAQPKLNKAMLDKIPIPHPEVPEQQRIADCLSSLDDLIAAQTQTLEALKTHKQGLMQKLFPYPELVEA